jgi:4-amino-4-deoxy-L-arabinose transferase-like glycosyltransferase
VGYQLANDRGNPPVSDILMASSNRIFYEKLGIMDDISSYYLYVLLLSALTIFFVYYFTVSFAGRLTGILAASTLALYPLYFSESHFNIKDIPELSFFTISVIAFFFWVKRQGYQ